MQNMHDFRIDPFMEARDSAHTVLPHTLLGFFIFFIFFSKRRINARKITGNKSETLCNR